MTDPPIPNLREITAQLAEQLGELADQPRRQIWRVVKTLGVEASLALAEEALHPETRAAFPRLDGTPRTPGGVFFALVRQRASSKQRHYIFWKTPAPGSKPLPAPPSAPERPIPQPTPPAPAVPPAPPFQWAERLSVLAEIGREAGGASTVKVTLIGRPGKVIERQGFVLLSMPAMKLPSLPKGLPTPPDVQTPSAVYIAAKQWRKVAEALTNPEDALIVEGAAVFDQELQGLAVFATNVTTKQLQSAKRNTTPGASAAEAE